MIPPVTTPEFFLIRHGETDWNREGRLQGQRDIPLNPLGRDQANGAGRILRDLLLRRGFEARAVRFIASPLGRARETMERVRTALGLTPGLYTLDERLKEIGFGDWEGMTWGELKRAVPLDVKARKRDKWAYRPPGAESYADLAGRVEPWLATVERGDVVVAHGGVARVILQMRGAVSAADAPDFDIVQGRVLWLHAEGNSWV